MSANTSTDTIHPLLTAARANDIEAMAAAVGATAREIRAALCIVAERGNVEAMELLGSRGATLDNFELAAYAAAHGGRVAAIEFAMTRGVTIRNNELMTGAARGGQLAIMHWLRNRNPDYSWDYNRALGGAAAGNWIAAMELARMWGATYYNRALARAATHASLDAMAVLREWGATDFNDALGAAAEENRLDAMALLRDWGANDFNSALIGAVIEGALAAMTLLRKWGAITSLEDVAATLPSLTTTNENADALALLATWIKEDAELAAAKARHRAIFEATLAMTALSLPTYVILWITDEAVDVPPGIVGLTQYKRVRLIERTKSSIEKVRTSHPI